MQEGGEENTNLLLFVYAPPNHFYLRLVENLHLGTRCIMYPSLFAIVTIGMYLHSAQTITKVEK